MNGFFEFRHFSVRHRDSALKVGTDAVLLGAAMTMKESDRRALDIGTGCGVIALMAAQRSSGSLTDGAQDGGSLQIEAVEIDGPSAAEAAFNFEASPWRGRLHAIHSSLLALDASFSAPDGLRTASPDGLRAASPDAPRTYDLIFSNPPYYDDSLLNPDAREAAARHTRTLSYSDICDFAARHLTVAARASEGIAPASGDLVSGEGAPASGEFASCEGIAPASGGRLSMILPADVEVRLVRTAASYGLSLFRLVRVRTTPKKPVRRIIAEFVLGNAGCPIVSELVLNDASGERSSAYSDLTSDFYLPEVRR